MAPSPPPLPYRLTNLPASELGGPVEALLSPVAVLATVPAFVLAPSSARSTKPVGRREREAQGLRDAGPKWRPPLLLWSTVCWLASYCYPLLSLCPPVAGKCPCIPIQTALHPCPSGPPFLSCPR